MLPDQQNPYGFAKDTLRKQLMFLQNSVPFNLTWVRLFYLYGEGQSSNSLYTQLKYAVLRSSNHFNMSGGEQLRDFQSVEKASDYLVRLALLNENNGIVNVSSGHPIAIKDLVRNWLEQNGWDIQLNLGFYPYPDYEPMEFWGDNTYMKQLLKKL
jgi:dTDP-6-deoxy-L-talose 4-dehydrogenase (NAD+)